MTEKVMGVIAYLAVGILVARILVHLIGSDRLPDPFAFLVVLGWPIFVVVSGIGFLVRIGQ